MGHFKERCFPQRRKVAKKIPTSFGFLGVFAPLREIFNSTTLYVCRSKKFFFIYLALAARARLKRRPATGVRWRRSTPVRGSRRSRESQRLRSCPAREIRVAFRDSNCTQH